jgi:hypothetical protein
LEKSICREAAFWFVILLSIILFFDPLLGGMTFYVRDTSLVVLPQYQNLFGHLREDPVPLWNAYSHGGQPALANLAFAPLYPLHVLFLFLPFLYAFNLLTVLHLVACPITAYICARTLRYSATSSCVVALVFGLGGYTLSLGNLLSILRGVPYIPLLVALWHLRLDSGKTRWFILSVVAGAMQVLSGAPDATAITMLSLLLWSLAYPYPRSTWLTRTAWWGLLVVCVVGVAAVQLVPSGEMVLWSARSPGVGFDNFTKWSLYPRRLPELIVPGFWMDYRAGSVTSFWGWEGTDEHFPFILSLYIGATSLCLALAGALQPADRETLPRRLRYMLLIAFMGCLLLALGRFAPFSILKFLYHYVPLMTIFRYPVKFLLGGLLPLALLAGAASERYFGTQSCVAPARRFRIVLWGIALLFVGLTVGFVLSDGVAEVLQVASFQQSRDDIRANLQWSLVHTASVWILFAFLCQYRAMMWRAWQPYLLILILVVDLLPSGKEVNRYAPPQLYAPPPAARMVSDVIENGRLYKERNRNEDILLTSPPPYDPYLWSMRWKIEILESYAPLFYRIPFIFARDTEKLSQKYVHRLTKIVTRIPWQQRLPFLSAAGVTAIITQDVLALPGLQRIAEIPNKSNLKFYLYRNDQALPRVAFVSQWQVASSDAEAIYMMSDGRFQPRARVILQKPAKAPFVQPVDDAWMQKLAAQASPPCAAAEVVTTSSAPSSARYRVSNPCDGILVFAEPYYPGWQISVDRQPRPLLRANYAFSGVYLTAGQHIVERYYRPASLRLGIVISVVCCIAISLGVAAGLWRRRSKRLASQRM